MTTTRTPTTKPMRCALRGMLLALATPAIVGCAAWGTTVNRDQVLAPQDGGVVVMRIGTPLVVSLSADPANGYGWVLTSNDANVLAIGGPDYMQGPKPPGMVGIPGATTYRFRARAAGLSTLEFSWQAAPGQPSAPPRVVRYDVTILPAGWFGVL